MTNTFTDDDLYDGYDRLTRQIVEGAPLLLYIYDMRSQQILYATRSLPWLLGYGEDASTTQAADWLYRLIHSDDKWQLLPSRDSLEAMPRGEVLQTLFRLRHAQGTWRWFAGQTVIFAQDDAGTPQQIVCAAQDITTRKQAEDALIDSRNRATTILESITDAFIALDQEGNFTYVNQRAEDLLQQPRAELLGYPIQERLPDVVDTVFYEQATRALRENIPVSIEAFYAPRSMWVDARVYPSSVGISVYFRDSTATRQVQEQVSFQANVLAQVNDAVVAVDIHWRITFWNRGAEDLYGYSSDEVLGSTLEAIFGARWLDAERANETTAALSTMGNWRGEHQQRTKHNQELTVEMNVSVLRDSQENSVGLLAVIRDVTAQRRVQDLMQRRALHDTLTELPNRLLFLDKLDTALERAQQPGNARCAVLFLDLDNFKVVNDSLGHMVGDRMLIAVARTLQECVPAEAMVARFGGDEFIVLLEDVRATSEATEVADAIHHALEAPISLHHQSVVTSTSIGIALSNEHYSNPEDLLRDANVAMNRVKKREGMHTLVFDDTMHAKAQERFWIESDLRQALDNHELQAYYQPIVDLRHGSISGFEVLLRWQHPQHGWLSPKLFISIAEESDLIAALGQRVLHLACVQAETWVRNGLVDEAFTINVNISGREFFGPGLVERVSGVLQSSGLAAHHLKLEITEGVMMHHAEMAVHTLQSLRALGVQIALDDFAMEHSSLHYLSRFPVQMLKIDREFVQRMDERAENNTIVRAIVSLAQSLGLAVIAEGIETSYHLGYLKSMHCDYGQGFLFSKGVPNGDAEELLRNPQIWRQMVLDASV